MKKLLAILAILASPVLAQEPDTTPAATAASALALPKELTE